MTLDPLVVVLKKRRQEWGVSVPLLARLLHVSPSLIYKYELGTREPGITLVRAWAGWLDLDLRTQNMPASAGLHALAGHTQDQHTAVDKVA